MKKLILISIILFNFLYPQDVITNIIQNDDGHILKIKYYKKSNNKIELFKIENYYENGQIKEVVNYKDGKEHGNIIGYYENGQVGAEKNYKDGRKDGKWTYYYKDGQVSDYGTFKDGRKDGKWTYYWWNGQAEKEETYIDGELIKTKEF